MLLKIMFVAAVLGYASLFWVKDVKNPHLYTAIALTAIYELLFIAFHPLVGILTTVFLGILILICYFEIFTDKVRKVSIMGIYISGFIASCGIIYQVVETFAGRLF